MLLARKFTPAGLVSSVAMGAAIEAGKPIVASVPARSSAFFRLFQA